MIFAIEAMTMDDAIKADQGCVVQEVFTNAGKQFKNMDLFLVVIRL
jgi:pyruvate carboxylase